MSFRCSQTAASAALETMRAGQEVDRGSHRRPPCVLTAGTSIFYSMWTRLRRSSSKYAPSRTARRTPSMYSSSSRAGGSG